MALCLCDSVARRTERRSSESVRTSSRSAGRMPGKRRRWRCNGPRRCDRLSDDPRARRIKTNRFKVFSRDCAFTTRVLCLCRRTRGSLDVLDLAIKVRPSRRTVLSTDRRRHFQRQEGYERDQGPRHETGAFASPVSNARTNHRSYASEAGSH